MQMQFKKCQKNLDAFDALSSASDEVLREVRENESHGCRDGLILVLTTKALIFNVAEDDDSMSVSIKRLATFRNLESFPISASEIWQPLIGRPFGWGWVTMNQQGYCDGALLSFDGITPAILLESAASSIRCHSITSRDEVRPALAPHLNAKSNHKKTSARSLATRPTRAFTK